jgi:hypothetical protein
MKNFRILPDTRASTSWPFSSSTRKVAFGNASLTIASSVIASSFANLELLGRALFVDRGRRSKVATLADAQPEASRRFVLRVPSLTEGATAASSV